MKFCAPVKALAIVSCLATPAVAEITWDERYYNPAAAEDDLVLPMPCGGAMVFRPIQTPNADGAVGDVRVTLGQEGEDTPFLNGLRRSYVSGGFPSGEVDKGLFWMAKYEIAIAQWDVVMGEACPDSAPRRRGFVPAVELTPLQLAAFAERYTVWLMQNAPDSLPQAGETQAYLRLPTEDEWEFAARGGLAVEDAAFRSPRPPIAADQEPSEFIAHGGTDSAGGRVQAIGTLLPNPLGLHDMLGNAGEFVATPFSLVRHGRLHGQAGGLIKRGGDARTPLVGITSATRFEVPPYDLRTQSATADRFTTSRLVIAALAITSAEQSAQINEDLARIARIDEGLQNASSEEEIAAILDALEGDVATARARQQVAVIRETIAAGRAERNAQRDRSIRLIAQSGTLMCTQLLQRLRNALAIQALLPNYDELEQIGIDEGDQSLIDEVAVARAEAAASLQDIGAEVASQLNEYANLVEGLGDEYSLPLLERQLAIIKPDVESRGPRRAECLSLLAVHLERRVRDGFVEIDKAQLDFSELARSGLKQ